MIALVRRLFLKLRLLVVPGATRLARAGVGGAGVRRARRGNCRRHGIRLWVVIRLVWSSVQLVGATTNETIKWSSFAVCAVRGLGRRA